LAVSDLRERVARKICMAVDIGVCEADDEVCPTCLAEADAAIAIIRAETLEEAARVADEFGDCAGFEVAEAIRALKDTTQSEGGEA
jgi:hypothetical protein